MLETRGAAGLRFNINIILVLALTFLFDTVERFGFSLDLQAAVILLTKILADVIFRFLLIIGLSAMAVVALGCDLFVIISQLRTFLFLR